MTDEPPTDPNAQPAALPEEGDDWLAGAVIEASSAPQAVAVQVDLTGIDLPEHPQHSVDPESGSALA